MHMLSSVRRPGGKFIRTILNPAVLPPLRPYELPPFDRPTRSNPISERKVISLNSKDDAAGPGAELPPPKTRELPTAPAPCSCVRLLAGVTLVWFLPVPLALVVASPVRPPAGASAANGLLVAAGPRACGGVSLLPTPKALLGPKGVVLDA